LRQKKRPGCDATGPLSSISIVAASGKFSAKYSLLLRALFFRLGRGFGCRLGLRVCLWRGFSCGRRSSLGCRLRSRLCLGRGFRSWFSCGTRLCLGRGFRSWFSCGSRLCLGRGFRSWFSCGSRLCLGRRSRCRLGLWRRFRCRSRPGCWRWPCCRRRLSRLRFSSRLRYRASLGRSERSRRGAAGRNCAGEVRRRRCRFR
jgi:hypothetical protein